MKAEQEKLEVSPGNGKKCSDLGTFHRDPDLIGPDC